VLAALAGLVFASRLNTATPKAGLGLELDVIAACFIGGASEARRTTPYSPSVSIFAARVEREQRAWRNEE